MDETTTIHRVREQRRRGFYRSRDDVIAKCLYYTTGF